LINENVIRREIHPSDPVVVRRQICLGRLVDGRELVALPVVSKQFQLALWRQLSQLILWTSA
jgi:hypothetical protein